MSEIYQSTKALSVYNVLSLAKQDLTRERIEAFLRSNFDVNLPADYVAHGADYLVQKKLAREENQLLTIDRLPNGLGKPVVRCNEDRDLVRASF